MLVEIVFWFSKLNKYSIVHSSIFITEFIHSIFDVLDLYLLRWQWGSSPKMLQLQKTSLDTSIFNASSYLVCQIKLLPPGVAYRV